MSMETVTFKLHPEARRVLEQIAREDDLSPGQILRDLLDKEIRRRRHAKPPVRADERLVAPLRARLARDLAESSNWHDLQERLHRHGYELREAGGGLALFSWPEGVRQCKASELGFSYSKLMRRIGAPFPGHSHSWLETRFLTKDEEEDLQLIEPF